jgi:hypothetical protein
MLRIGQEAFTEGHTLLLLLRVIPPSYTMADTSKTVPVFYEPGAPPIIPQLLSQTNVLLHAHQIPSLLAHEEIYVGRNNGVIRTHQHLTHSSRSRSPYTKSVAFYHSRRLSSSPPPSGGVQSAVKKGVMRKPRSPTPEEDFVPSDCSQSPDDGESSRLSVNDFRIPKPVGEAGRPGSGGYNLGVELAWLPKSLKELKVLYLSSLMPFSCASCVSAGLCQ